MSESTSQSAGILTRFEQAVSDALVVSTRNVIRAASPFLYNIDLSVTASFTELDLMYKERNSRFLKVASLCIPYKNHNGATIEVPVTPVYQPVERQSFHTITLRHTDGGTVVILIRESDNYVIGLRVYLNEQESLHSPWLIFRGVSLPSRFRNVVEMRYDLAYDETIVDMKFGKNTLSDIVQFLFGFRTNPQQRSTDKGKLLMCSLFILFGEAQRFKSARDWILRASQRVLPEKIPMSIAGIFRKWSDLSKLCFELYLACKKGSEDGLRDATSNWKLAERFQENTVLKFRNLQNNIDLNCLLGSEVLLLKHDFNFCTRIIMFLQGYKEDLMIRKYNIKKIFGKNIGSVAISG